MNKLKKISILFAAVLSLTMLASCGSDSKDTNKSDKSDSSTAEDKAVFGFKFTVNGEEYAVPAPFKDFADKGLSLIHILQKKSRFLLFTESMKRLHRKKLTI